MKDFFGGVLSISIFVLSAVGYINNIIWMIDKWGYLDWLEKAGSIIGVFTPPLGIILGIIHLF